LSVVAVGVDVVAVVVVVPNKCAGSSKYDSHHFDKLR